MGFESAEDIVRNEEGLSKTLQEPPCRCPKRPLVVCRKNLLEKVQVQNAEPRSRLHELRQSADLPWLAKPLDERALRTGYKEELALALDLTGSESLAMLADQCCRMR